MTEPKREYRAYLLRLWQVGGKSETGWRASLESPHTGQSHGFPSLNELFLFLRRQTGAGFDTEDVD